MLVYFGRRLSFFFSLYKFWSGTVDFRSEDIFGLDFSVPNVIVMFLVPNMLAPLSELWLKSLKTGTKILSYNFPLPPPWVPEQTQKADHHQKPPPATTNVYFYRAGPPVDAESAEAQSAGDAAANR